jgi:hypothetical protein
MVDNCLEEYDVAQREVDEDAYPAELFRQLNV